MKSLQEFPKIHLYMGVVDFRKWIDGLSGIVQSKLGLDPFSEELFVFPSRDRRRIKILYWDKSGFAVWYKRLEKEKFVIRKLPDETLIITSESLEWLLNGYDIFKMKSHKNLQFSSVL